MSHINIFKLSEIIHLLSIQRQYSSYIHLSIINNNYITILQDFYSLIFRVFFTHSVEEMQVLSQEVDEVLLLEFFLGVASQARHYDNCSPRPHSQYPQTQHGIRGELQELLDFSIYSVGVHTVHIETLSDEFLHSFILQGSRCKVVGVICVVSHAEKQDGLFCSTTPDEKLVEGLVIEFDINVG
jgi:hypothetical protein